MNWKTKSLIQQLLSRMPGGSYLYYLGQQYFFGFRDFRIEPKIRNGLTILKGLSTLGKTLEGKEIVEIGTGWQPIIPIFFWLLGCEKCTSFDITRLLQASLVTDSVNQLLRLLKSPNNIFDKTFLSSIRSDRLKALHEVNTKNIDEIFDLCNLIYQAPHNALSSDLQNESVDIVFSNEVLEHVPESEMKLLFPEIYRILRVGGLMVHNIDLGDHFSHTDSAITRINFLKFSASAFSKYNSRFLYQNRLRIPAYKQLIKESGFSIVSEDINVNKDALRKLPSVQIHADFSKYTPEELCTINYCVIAMR